MPQLPNKYIGQSANCQGLHEHKLKYLTVTESNIELNKKNRESFNARKCDNCNNLSTIGSFTCLEHQNDTFDYCPTCVQNDCTKVQKRQKDAENKFVERIGRVTASFRRKSNRKTYKRSTSKRKTSRRKRVAKKKRSTRRTSKRKISKRKISKRSTSKRKTSRRKRVAKKKRSTRRTSTSKRKTSKRKTSKRKTSKRKISKRKTSRRKRAIKKKRANAKIKKSF